MKKSLGILCGGLLIAGSAMPTYAQRDAPTRQERREGRQQGNENLTPEQQRQNMQQRWQERYNNATPEQRQRMDAMRQDMEKRMRDAGIDPAAPDAFQQARDKGVFQGMGGGGMGGGGGRGQLTPEQRDEARKALMTQTGIGDSEIQNAIVQFVNEREKARATLLELARAAATALKAQPATPADAKPAEAAMDNAEGGAKVVQTAADGEAPAPAPKTQAELDADVAKSFDAYQKALAEDRVAYAAGLKDLDQKVHFSTNPRIKAFLALTGILEYDPLSFGGVGAIFSNGQQQGGGGQGRGGRGGRNGGQNGGGQDGGAPAPPAGEAPAPPPAE